jgi:hypothetical protein
MVNNEDEKAPPETVELYLVTVESELGIPFMGHNDDGLPNFIYDEKRREVAAYTSLPVEDKLQRVLRNAEEMEIHGRGPGYGAKAKIAPVTVSRDELRIRGGSTLWKDIHVLDIS